LKKKMETPLKIGALKLLHLNRMLQIMMTTWNLKCLWRSIVAFSKKLMVSLRWRM